MVLNSVFISFLKVKLFYMVGLEPVSFNICLATVPKSGTHIMQSLIRAMGYDHKGQGVHTAQYSNVFKDFPKSKYIGDPKSKYIVTIRDPRDAICSLVDMVSRKGLMNENEKLYPSWLKENFATRLKKAIHLQESGYVCDTTKLILKSSEIAIQLIRSNYQNVLILKFEDLIGKKYGGNSSEAKLSALKSLVSFLDFNFSDEKIKQIAQKTLHKETATYIGEITQKVGRWKTYFTSEDKNYFMKKYGSLCRNLGYLD